MLTRHADPFVAERAGRIQTAAERCARIVSSFVALARSRPQERQLVDVNRIVRAAVELLAYPLHVDNIKVTQQLDDRLPAVWADGHQLQQVVVNLVANAHHALRAVEGQRRLTLTTRRQPVPEAVVLDVADTGSGIPAEVRPRLFEPFFTTKRAGEGIGLGLALCQGVIEGHGGRIEVESEPGRGACFRIVLPLGRPGEGSVVASTPAAAPPATTGDILVVDDEAEIAALLTEVLAEVGHHVDTASNGLDALERLARRRYDVIVSDIRMPGLDGPGLYRATVEQRPDLARRFVFVTGDTFDPASREFLEQTRLPIIEKPLVIEEVRRLVAQTLGVSAPAAADGSATTDEAALRTRARDKLERGGLPRAPEAMLWAAPGTNEPCALCDQAIRPDDMEHEVHVRLGAEVKRFPFHRPCHAVWELERARAG
jgi:two-component system NtrC family sensor kinase